MSTKYMFLIYSDEASMADATPEQWDQMLQAHNAWAASVVAAGATIHGGDALAPSATATTVRTGGAAPVVTDGPFAETKDWVMGYGILACRDLAEAVEVSSRHPAARPPSSPTAPSPRPRRRSAASTSSSAPTSTRRSPWRTPCRRTPSRSVLSSPRADRGTRRRRPVER